mgnify:CR=1 FL=1
MSSAENRRAFLKQLTVSGVAASGMLEVVARAAGAAGTATEIAGKRVFVAKFNHETNTFHPVKTKSFIFQPPLPDHSPYLAGLKKGDVHIVQGVYATPAGGGTVDGAACREAIDRILKSLRDAMPVDAVFLRVHGAMYAEDVGPAETVLVERVREIVGPKIPIACTFDLHGNIPSRLAEVGDILVGYKTAPHVDMIETSDHASRLLLATLRGEVRPVSYALPIPLLLQGEKSMTTSEPFHSLVEEAKRIEQEGVPGHKEKILAATLFVGCAWTDSADTSMCAVVTADGSRAAARAAAIHLARKIWEARTKFDYGCEAADLEDGVSRALAAKESTVFLSDTGDNVTASAPGDLPIVLRYLVERKVANSVVAGILDPVAVQKCYDAGEGNAVQLAIGTSIEKRCGPPLEANARVIRLATKDGGRVAVVKIGEVEAVLCERTPYFLARGHFKACGIDPLSYKIVVVKEGYLYPDLRTIAPRHIMLLTPGSGDMHLERLPYVRRRKPMYPLEPATTFDPDQAPA